MVSPDYDKGFTAGLMWVANALRLAADRVEVTKRSTFERKSGNGSETFEAISRIGDVHFARALREVAQTIEDATT